MGYKFLYKVKSILGITLMTIPFIFSCSDEIQTKNSIDFSLEKRSESTVSEIISNYSIVKLETSEDSKINIIKKVVIQNEKIFVLNFQENKQEVMIFSMDGEYLGKIPDNGETEKKISTIVDFDIHPVKGNVAVLDQKQGQVVIFGEDTKFVERYKIDGLAEEMAYGTKDGAVFTVLHTKFSDQSSEPGSEINTYDEQFKLLETYFPYNDQNSSVQSNERTLMKRNGAVMFLREGTNNLYEIESGKCRNISDFIFPNPVLPTDKMYDAFYSGKVDLTHYIFNVDYFESDSIVYTTFSGIDGNYIGIYNKETGVSKLYNMLLDPSCKCGIKIDIVGSFRNHFIVQIPRTKIPDILEVLDKERSKCSNQEVFEIIDNMRPGENPILLLMEFNF
jgi:hypothetical protein